MSIYRGAGGSGDAVADSSSEALLVRELAAATQIEADAAAASATAASTSASNAATSASNAATSASNASTSATNASNSASAASSSASAAASSATDAETAQTAAETAQTAAELAQTGAETAESNASTSASNAAGSATTATTQASNASTSASNAATSASNAATSESNASTYATSASNSATAASGSASAASTSASNASTSESNAATSESNAASSASTATTQAGLASTSASNAATSESNAATSASNAATSESNAATSASTATSAATAAGTSATDAAASAAAAAASYDSFDDRYLGVKTADPTLDNDGNALVTGALYYNDGTVTPADKGMYVYDGSQWIAASAASTAILTVFKYTATAAQTTFTGADDNSLTLTYTAGSAIVTVNGAVMEIGTDVTATSGTDIVLAQAALAGDEVNIYAFATFNLANVYTREESDLKYLTITNPSYTGTLTGGTGIVNLGSGQFYKDASGNVGIGTSSPRFKLSIGALTATSTATPDTIDLGGTYSSTAGANTKLRLLWDGSFTYGLGVSAAQLDYVVPSASHVFWTNSSERMRIDSSGNLLVGTTTPNFANLNSLALSISGGGSLVVNHNSSATSGASYANFGYNGGGIGSITQSGTTAVAYNTSSDYRLKENIAPMTGALDTVAQLKPVTYNWKADGSDGQGFIAHELQEVVPDCVTGEKDAVDEEGKPVYQGIDTSFLVATLTAAIQEQQVMIEELKAKVAALEAK